MVDKDFIMIPETLLGNSKTRPLLRLTTTKKGGKEGLEKSQTKEGEKEKERDKEKEKEGEQQKDAKDTMATNTGEWREFRAP